MAFENETNKGRVAKMVETLDLLRKSAQSNRASKTEMKGMLRPLTDELSGMGLEVVEAAKSAKVSPGRYSVSGPQWANVRDMAEQAPLKDLGVAVCVYINRVGEELSDEN